MTGVQTCALPIYPRCHSYLPTLVVDKSIIPVVEDAQLIGDFVADFSGHHADRREGKRQILVQYLRAMLAKPIWFGRIAQFVASHLWRGRRELLAARGKVHQLSFFVHNFMDASALDPERINACSFMAMTHQGPVSMCEHNARRDDYILKPLQFRRADGSFGDYQPISTGAR